MSAEHSRAPVLCGALLKRCAACGLLALAGCGGFGRFPWRSTQQWPGPMQPLADPLPSGDRLTYAEGPEMVMALRHADPVQVRPAGLPSSFPLSFYKKDIRLHSGSAVYSAPGGRIEVLWPSGTSVLLFGQGAGIIGSQSRGEPTFLLQQVERAQLMLQPGDQIELLGGSLLSGDSGPFVLEHTRADILRVKNQSKTAGTIAFREAVFTLDPGQAVDLPLLSAGGKPAHSDVGWTVVQGVGFEAGYNGAVDALNEPDAVALRARGEHEIRGLGVRVRMERDEELRLQSLGAPRSKASVPAVPPPAPKEIPKEIPEQTPKESPKETPTQTPKPAVQDPASAAPH